MTSRYGAKSHGKALYRELGGKSGIRALMDHTVNLIRVDQRINHYFNPELWGFLKQQLTAQICQLSGGSCVYRGPTMAQTHRGMNITSAAFNALVEDLEKAMAARRVPLAAQNALLRILAPMKPAVINNGRALHS